MKVYVHRIERLSNSINGNPRWELTVSDSGNDFVMRTKTDSTAGYIVDWNCEHSVIDVDCHRTRKGNFIIDYVYRG